ncbi:TetR/AcrR family transcriptional regulator [Mycobacterium sp. CVI_P3]|uniref:TetR/AcrR family transcriptional regulator n=1 Tax=Mycobacterium pinniadriaticum TaxID=2994102 RepID=A0ABT3SP08_9MYCO|nr:TetR/AcrR family transcriptional regulator [Mycobacterium pinniadriaticum]MCX2934854.1 TetR/AcrR family transcriptional regulator [Mycobacterium pinniadriaticum]MCX2941269.1 TetR/AcrR family transcriptional regulator [Mycobacterium pinniadriaticum]
MSELHSDLAGVTREPTATPGKRGPGRPTLSNEQLLDTALDLFLENGYERTGIEAIAAAAGMAKRTVYARYGDKTTLFKAALTRAIEEWIVPIDVLRQAESEDLEATLLRVGQLLVVNVLRPGGQRLLRLTNTVSGQMPEIAAFNVQKGTEPTLVYLADLFRRRLGLDAASASGSADAAEAFIDLVVGGPANLAARGVVIDDAAIDKHTRYCIGLFLHGVLPKDRRSLAVEEENARLKKSVTDALTQIDQARERLDRALDERTANP